MLTKNQLQQEVQNLEAKLQEFREQLNTYKAVTIETAGVGDTLGDGSIILLKNNGLALLVAPKNTEVEAPWTKEFPLVFQKLKEEGFNPSQWFVPSIEQLKLAYINIPNEFSSTNYWSNWSSTESNASSACFVLFNFGYANIFNKNYTFCVRAFRCVTY
jgi:hypothetical protein